MENPTIIQKNIRFELDFKVSFAFLVQVDIILLTRLFVGVHGKAWQG